jgi:hypothetical protein
MRVNYTHEAGGVAWHTTSELWIVPRGDLLFIIGAGTRGSILVPALDAAQPELPAELVQLKLSVVTRHEVSTRI